MDRNALLGSYLRQQSNIVTQPQQPRQPPSETNLSVASSSHQRQHAPVTGGEIVHVDGDTITLEEFKEYVKKYIDTDTWLKKAQEVMKEKKLQKKLLSDIIIKFMIKYDIEDLNCKTGKIKCKVKQVKQPISQKVIKEKISDYFKTTNESSCTDIIKKVFDERPTVQKVSLRHLRIS